MPRQELPPETTQQPRSTRTRGAAASPGLAQKECPGRFFVKIFRKSNGSSPLRERALQAIESQHVCDMCRFAFRNGPSYSLKRPVSQSQTTRFGTQNGTCRMMRAATVKIVYFPMRCPHKASHGHADTPSLRIENGVADINGNTYTAEILALWCKNAIFASDSQASAPRGGHGLNPNAP